MKAHPGLSVKSKPTPLLEPPPPEAETGSSHRGKKSWREKLADDKNLPRVIKLNATAAARWGGRTLVIPAPREVDAIMRRVPAGKVTTINDVRAALAQQHQTEAACAITTGIFSWIAAHAADEAAAAGETDTTPYWRTLKAKGTLNPKYPGGIPALTARLEAEGHQVVQKGKRFFVRDYEKVVAKV
jgi:alkylated DNA nucleotide flippase Atl1